LQFPGFGVIDVITRAIAGKEMRTYDDLYHFRRSHCNATGDLKPHGADHFSILE
jgi:hypothetical protein